MVQYLGVLISTWIGITDSLNFYGISVTELKEMFEQSINYYLEITIQIKSSKLDRAYDTLK